MTREYSQQRRQLSIILYAMKNNSFTRFVAALALALALATCVANSALAAPQKGATKKAPAKKAISKKAPVKKGVLLRGEGPMRLNVTLSSRGANLLRGTYQSFLVDKYDDIVSKGTIAYENGVMVVVGLTDGEIVKANPNDLAQSMTITFASTGGLWPGQTIPVSLPEYRAPDKMPQSLSFMNFTQTEIKKVKSKYGRESTKLRGSSWVATRGTIVIGSISPKTITFTLKNVVLEVPKERDPSLNVARGILVLNGTGEVNLTKIPDGFH